MSRWRGFAVGAVVGLAAAASAIGAAELVAAFVGPAASPVVSVGRAVIDATPRPVKEFGISTFGTHDKLALQLGIYLLLAAFAALVGRLALVRFGYGVAGVAVFGVIGAAAAMTRPDGGPLDMLPSLLGAAAGVFVLRRLLRAAPPSATPAAAGPAGSSPGADRRPTVDPRTSDRRRFLYLGVGATVGAVAVGLAGRGLQHVRFTAVRSRAETRIPVPASRASALPVSAGPRVDGMSSFFTPNATFYRIDTALTVPQLDARDWRLRIHGMVDRPLTISYADLAGRALIERDITLTCVSNEVGGSLIGTARWIGAPLAELLTEAGVHPEASQLVSRSSDGMTIGTPTAAVLDGRDAMLAIGMNGEPLPIEHGFPVRMVVPGLYGYVSACKWLVELELTTFDGYDAYWVRQGWAAKGPIKTGSRIDTPRSGRKLSAGEVTVAGVAWAQHVGIEAVEVQVDDHPWAPARLLDAATTDTWRLWTYRWSATRGDHTLRVRATDSSGTVQTSNRAEPYPDGATGWHTIDVPVS